MHITEAIKIAFLSLWANKLRSALTLLGVVIGVAAVIAVVTFVNGINGYVATKIFNLGADVFIVFKVSPAVTNIDKFLEGEKRKDLTMEDYEAVLEACKHCEWVGAALRNDSGHVKFGEQSISDTIVRGMTPSMVPILDIDLTAGRMINDIDVRNNSAVVVIGPDIVENLMPGMDPINKEVRIDGWVYRVVGVGKRKGKTLGQSLDNYAIMPITSFQKQNGTHTSIRISGKASASGAGFDEAMDETRATLRARRHVRPGDEDNFDIETNDSLLSIWSNFSGTFFYAMIGIAAISLVVGGIVIMNIMLVSVTERTREIGIRKAVGARQNDILRQFLADAMLQCIIGGALGVALGFGAATLLKYATDFPADVKGWVAALGLTLASVIGLFFGIYPATKAAKLDPVVALRSD